VIALILSDIPGVHFNLVASGPTYQDESTNEEAQQILSKYNLENLLCLTETPKDNKYFENVTNVRVVSNLEALEGMKKRAEELGYVVEIFGTEVYEHPHEVVQKMFEQSKPGKVLIAGGEPAMKIVGPGGIGGRNEYISAYAYKYVKGGQVFSSFASDGIDNLSHASGGLTDTEPKKTNPHFDSDLDTSLSNNSIDQFLLDHQVQIITGPTGSNVSDLLILLEHK
jgi:hydroxypyruvate reductase